MQTETQKRLDKLALAASVNNTAGRTGLTYPDRQESVSGGAFGLGPYDPLVISGEGSGLKKRRPRARAAAPKKKKRKPKVKEPSANDNDDDLKAALCAGGKKKRKGKGLIGAGLVGQGLKEDAGGPGGSVSDAKQGAFGNHGVGPEPGPSVGGGLVVALKKGEGMKAKAKRAPSAYNKFVKEFAKSHKGKDMMKLAAAAWSKQKK